MKQVFCIGELLIDFVGQGENGNIAQTDSFLKKAGGAPANVAAAVARLEGKSSFIGAIGRDPFGEFLKETLLTENIDITYLQRVDIFTTLAFVSLGEEGARDFVFSRGADATLSYDSSLAQKFKEQVVHFGAATAFLGGALRETYYRYLSDAQSQQALICFDPNYREDLHASDPEGFVAHCMHFIERAHLCKMSEEEALLISNCSTLEDACLFFQQKSNATICVTLGKNGTLVSIPNQPLFTVDTIRIEAIDTTGSGDAFIGCLLAQWAKTTSGSVITDKQWLKSAVTLANKAGAFTALSYGAIAALPRVSDLATL